MFINCVGICILLVGYITYVFECENIILQRGLHICAY